MRSKVLCSFQKRIARDALFYGCLEALEERLDATKLTVNIFKFLNVLALLVKVDNLLELFTIELVSSLLSSVLITHLNGHECELIMNE